MTKLCVLRDIEFLMKSWNYIDHNIYCNGAQSKPRLNLLVGFKSITFLSKVQAFRCCNPDFLKVQFSWAICQKFEVHASYFLKNVLNEKQRRIVNYSPNSLKMVNWEVGCRHQVQNQTLGCEDFCCVAHSLSHLYNCFARTCAPHFNFWQSHPHSHFFLLYRKVASSRLFNFWPFFVSIKGFINSFQYLWITW